VEQGAHPYGLQLAAVQAELLAHLHGELGDGLGVAAGIGVLGLERRCERRHGCDVLLLDGLGHLRRAEDDPGLVGQEAAELALLGGEDAATRVEELDQTAGARPHHERREQAGLEAHVREEGVLGRVAAVADRGRGLDQLVEDPPGGRVVVERIVLGGDVERRRRDDVRRPVGHHLRLRVERRDEAGGRIEEQRELAREAGHRIAGISRRPQRPGRLDDGDQVRKPTISRNSPGTHGYPKISASSSET
jgi:hypothetical protein